MINPYISSITSRYGDLERVKADGKVLRDILARQGSELLIDVIAETAAETAIRFKMNDKETLTLRLSLMSDLQNALQERM